MNQFSAWSATPTAAYVHIPFCRRRCFYCDFPISVLGDRLTEKTVRPVDRYVDALCREIRSSPGGQRLKTVFFGGGTPSLLSVDQLGRILETLALHLGIDSTAEISMEIDPGTFDLGQLQGYVAAGVNRLSLGVQAFQDELLQLCGRSHSTSDIFRAIEQIRRVGITNYSLDLISGLPHQTLVQWQSSLEQAIALEPAHLSCYDLIIEPQTPFSRQYRPGKHPLPEDEVAAQMYRLARQILTAAGYEHYEISNYAKAGFQCRHNRVYWENRPYYGFGMGATSYLNGCRLPRPRTRQEYYQWLEQQDGSQGCEPGENSTTEVLLETLMLRLRLAEGIDLQALQVEFGEQSVGQLWHCVQRYYRQGWVELEGKVKAGLPQGRLRLSDPEGFLYSNTVLAAIFDRFGEPEKESDRPSADTALSRNN